MERAFDRNIGDKEESAMLVTEKRAIAIFVDKTHREHWIVRDADGDFWIVPPVENPWANRQAFEPTDSTELEPVPGHYIYMLGLPRI